MMMMNLVSTTVFLLLVATVDAYPSGAGACPGGMAAVGGSHLSRTITNGTLEEGGYTFSIGAWPVLTGEHIKTGFNDMTIAGDTPFKGFLIRFEGPEGLDLGVGTLEQDDSGNVRLEETYCPPGGASGVTHTSNADKTEIKGSYDIAEAGGEIMVDVTVVVSNSGTESVFYYSSYKLTAGKEEEEEEEEEEGGDEETTTTEEGDADAAAAGNATDATEAPAPDATEAPAPAPEGDAPAPSPGPDSSSNSVSIVVATFVSGLVGVFAMV